MSRPAFKAGDRSCWPNFRRSNRAVIDGAARLPEFLKERLLPRIARRFPPRRRQLYRKKLLYEEMVDTPLDRLLEIGYEDLRRNQEAFRATAAKIDPKQTPQQILEQVEKDHPTAAGKLLQAFRDSLGGLRDFIVAAQHRDDSVAGAADSGGDAALHARPDLRLHGYAGPVREGRQGSLLQRDAAGDGAGRRSRPRSIMRAFNRGTIVSTAIHEAYPGHYVQFLWMQHVQSKVAS